MQLSSLAMRRSSAERLSVYAGVFVFAASLSLGYWSEYLHDLDHAQPINETIRSLLLYNELPGLVFRQFTVFLSANGDTSTGYQFFNATAWSIASLLFSYVFFSLLRQAQRIRRSKNWSKESR